MIGEVIIEKERAKGFQVDSLSHFRYRTRHFTESVVIGCRDYVTEIYIYFKERVHSKREKKPHPVHGIERLYSLRRLSEP